MLDETQVNAFTAGNQSEPKVTTLIDGSYIIVWQSIGQDGSGEGIYAQRYSAQGQRIGAEFEVNTTNVSTQSDPAISYLEGGGFVVVWEAIGQDGSVGDFGVIGQRFAADGTKLGTEFVVNSVNTTFTQFDPEVTAIPGGGFAVTFIDDLGDSSSDGIRVRFYDAAGNPTGADIQVNTEVSSNQSEPAIATIQPGAGANDLVNGGVVVVWTSPVGDGSSNGVFGQIYAANGNTVGSEFLINTTTTNNQSDASVAGLDGGRFIVVWEDSNPTDGSGVGVFGQIFEGDGTAVGTEFQINEEFSSSQFDPEVAATTDGGFVVTWTSVNSGSAGDGSFNGVFARRFDVNGVATTSEFQINEETTWDQERSDVTPLANGDFVAVWQSDTQGTAGDGDGLGIFQRLFVDPNTFVAPSASPEVEAVSTTRIFAENAVNAAPQLLDADGAAAVSDADSTNFDGGRLILASIAQSVSEDGFTPQDADEQDQLSLNTVGPVAIAGTDVTVNGTLVGSIVQDGANGADLVIDLNANADAAAVEILIENLTYQNTSDDPRPNTTLSLLLEDGDGGTSEPIVINVQITSEADIDGKVGVERQVNTVTVDDQNDSAIATLADGGYVSVWTSDNQDNTGDGDDGIFAQRFDANGKAVGAEFQVNQTVTSSQFDADIAGLNDGGWVIVWDDDTINGIRLNRYDAAGALTQTEVQVDTETSGNQFQPQVEGLSNGGYVVTWTSQNSGDAGDGNGNGVIAQLFNAAGALVGGEIIVNQQTTGAQDTSAVAALNNGRFVVVWEENDVANGDGSGTSVSARIFNDSGVPEANEFQVNSFTSGAQNVPRVATLANGDFVVAWRSEGQDSSSGGIYYQRFTDQGVQVGGETRVNDSTSGDQTVPDIIALDTGGFVVSWTDTSTPAPGSSVDVFAQVFDADGTRLDSEVLINTEVAAAQDEAVMTALPNGNYVVQWTSQTSGSAGDGSADGIFQQIIGDPTEISQSAAPVVVGLPQIITLDEDDAHTGGALAPAGALALSDSDSSDLDGGRIRLARVVTDPAADGFNAPDDESQDSLFVAQGGIVTIVGTTISVGGVAVANIVSDGLNGADLELDLLAGATIERVESLLNALTYQTDSDNPRPTRTYSLTIEDGDGGLTQPISLQIAINQVAEANAPQPVGAEEAVNSFTAGNQSDQEVAVLTDGGWVVVWTSDGQDGAGNGIFGQRYSSEGVRIGGEFQVNATDANTQQDAVVTGLANGGWIVVWEANNQEIGGGTDFGIISQRFNADGTLAGVETVVNLSTPLTQFDAAVATISAGTTGFPAGGYVVVHVSDTGDGASDGIVMQRFLTDGTPVGGEQTVNTTITGNQSQPDVAVLSDGRIAVSWGSGNDIFARILNPDGTEDVAEFMVNATTASTQDDSSIAATADGGFVIAWHDFGGLDDSGQGIVAQRYDATGAAVDGEFVVNEQGNGSQGEPDVIGLDDGRFVIAWRDFSNAADGSGDSTKAQIFSATGERLDGEFILNRETTLSTQFSPELAALPGGNFVATFGAVTSGADGDGSSNGIFQQIYGDAGDFTPGAAPILQGISTSVTFTESDVNGGFQRIETDKTIALGDTDSVNFDGGVLTLAVDEDFNELDQLNAGDDTAQDMLGLVAGDIGNGDVQFSGLGVGDMVSVDGIVIGTISASGQTFSIDLGTNATIEAVEAVLGNLAYSNSSDAPAPVRRLSLDLTDGDGQGADTAFINVTVTPDDDVPLVASEESRVNAHTDNAQDLGQIVELSGGGFVVVWDSVAQDGLNVDFAQGIFGQLYDSDSVPVGREFQINTTAVLEQADPAVTATDDGGFVVVWEGQSQDNGGDGDFGIIGQRFDLNAIPQGGEFIVNTTIVSTQFDPAVAAFEGGGFVVTYVSDSGDGSADAILSRRFDAAGIPDGFENQVNTVNTDSNQSQPDVASLVNGSGLNDGHIIVFTAPTSGGDGDGDDSGVFAQRFDATGAPAGAEFQVNTTTINSQSDATVVGLSGGGFVIAWTDNSADGSSNGVFAQRYDVNGAAVGAEFRVNTDRINSESDADITALSDGGFLISWTAGSSQDGSGDGIFAQRFAADGSRVDGEFQINEEFSSTQSQSAITSFGTGFAAIWTSTTSAGAGDGSSSGIFLRTYESAPAADTSPNLGDVDRFKQLFADDVTTGAQVLDDAVAFSDPDNTDFDGGRLEVYYTAGETGTDQLSIVTDAVVTIASSMISVNGTVVGTINGTQNGANGAALVIDFNASSDAAAIKVIMERLAYASTDTAINVANTERGIGFVITDGDGGQSEPDSIFVDINAGAAAAPSGLVTDDWGDIESEQNGIFAEHSEAALNAAPVVIDSDIDFDDFEGTSFDGGFLRVQEVFGGSQSKQLSVQDQGTGSGQIGFDGINVSYEGTAIGVINGTSNGVNGATLQIDLNASATAEAIEALAEALTFGLNGGYNTTTAAFDLTIQNQAGVASNFNRAQTFSINLDLVEALQATSPESQVNTFTFDDQQSARVAALSDGGYVVTWTSEFQDDPNSANRGIFAQLYNAQGAQVGAEFQVNDIAAGDQIQPRAAGLDNGNFVLMWTENTGRDGSGQGVYGQIYNNDGTEVGAAFQVNEETSSTQNSAQIIDLGAGRFMATWTSVFSGSAGDGSGNGIFGRVFDATGTPEAGEFQINSTTASNQQRSRAIDLPDGDVMVVWEDHSGADGSGIGVFAQRIDTNGALVSFDGTTPGADERQINTTTLGSQDRPDVAALQASATLPNGGFVFVWESPDISSDGIFGQIYDINGVAQGGEFQINTLETNGQTDPVVIGTNDGGFVVAWSDASGIDGSGTGITAQRFNADGSANGLPFVVNAEISSTQSQPELAVLINGALAAVWTSTTSATAGDGDRNGVFQALFDQPVGPVGSGNPVLEGVDDTVSFLESVVNAAPQLLNQDGAVSLTDMDSADLDGGSILVARVVGSGAIQDELRGPGEGAAQDAFGVLDGNGVVVSGTQVSVDGNVIGTIVRNGSAGEPLEIALTSANATPEAVEAIIAQLSYANLSDGPTPTRQVVVQVADGDGGSTGSQLININVTSEADSTIVPQGDEEQVNTYVPGSQSDAAVSEIFDSSGSQIGYVVVWESADQDRVQDGGTGIFGQRYDLSGDPLGAEFQVALHTEFNQSDPSVTGLPTGGFVVGWSDNSFAHPNGVPSGETSTGTFAQIFDESGARVGVEFLVNDLTASTQNQLDLTTKANGTIVAVYTDHGNVDGSGQGVFMREFDATGAALGASTQVNVETASTQNDPAVAVLDGGRVVVTWTSFFSGSAGDGSGNGVFARVFEANGTAVGGEILVNSTTLSNQDAARVAALSDGGFIVVWDDDSGTDGSSTAVFQQRFDVDGNPVGGEVLVNDTTFSSQADPYVIAVDSGGWIVAWTDSSGSDGSGAGVVGQRFAADGSRIDDEFQINTEFSSTQSQPRLVSLPNDGFTAVWTSFTSSTAGDGDSNGVFQQVFANTGDVLVSTAPVLSGFDTAQTFDEATLNAGGQKIAPTIGLGDSDSGDFDGGVLTVSLTVNDTVQLQFGPVDDATQDQLGIDLSGDVSLAGNTVSIAGTVIGTITSDGVNGANLTIALNADGTADRVETLIQNLTYANISDDPETSRLITVQLTDGDGGYVRESVNITITPETDGAVAVDDEVQTNSFATGEQTDSHVAQLADGGYVVVWTSNNQDATGDFQDGIFAQRYDLSGAPVGGEFQVNTTTASQQFNAQVVGLSTGGFVVAWEDQSTLTGDDTDEEIVMQVYDANGQKVGGEIVRDSATAFDPDSPALAAFDNGDFLLVHHARDITSPFLDKILVQRFNDQGGFVGSEEEIAPLGSTGATDPDVAIQSDGTYVVVYTDRNVDNPGDGDVGVFLQRFAADDSQIGGPIQVNTVERFSQFSPKVAATEDGGYVVVFESDIADDFGFAATSGIYGQRFDGQGNKVGDEFLVNEIVDNAQNQPDVAAIGGTGGGFAVIYSDNNNTDGSGTGVFLQQYDAQGNRVDGRLQVNQEFSSTQQQGAISSLPNGNLVVSFTSTTSSTAGDGSGNGIFHRIIGDPADFASGGDPILDGINRSVTYTEGTLNGVPQLIDANGAAAVSDPDSADFDGGSILVSNIISSAPLIDQINPPDDLTQDQLGLRQDARVTIAGTAVSVDGTEVAQIIQDGQNGVPFELSLNTSATAEVVEVLVEHLTYRNISDDPLATRDLRIQITDGDGGASVPQLVTISITPTPDAALPVGDEQTVNTTVGTEDNPAIAQLPGTGGDFIVVWESFGTDGNNEGIFAQRFDVNGNKLNRDGAGLPSGGNDEFQVNTTTTQDQFDPQIAAFSNGGFVVTWTDDTLDGSGQGIVAQLFNPDGTPNGSEIVVNNLTSSTQNHAEVAVLDDDSFVVTWESVNSGGASDGAGNGILARHFASDGTPMAGQFVVNTETASTQSDPAITQLNDGGFLITWESFSSAGSADGDRFGVFAQRYDANAAAVGSEFQINTSTRSDQSNPQVTVLENGNLVVTWEDSVADLSGPGVYAAIFAPDGTPVSEEFRVNDQRLSTQNEPDIAALDTGGFVIAWTDHNGTDGSGQGVFAQQYDAEGNRLDSQFQVNTTTTGSQNQPSVEGLPGGGFVVGWNGSVLIQIYGNEAPTISPVAAAGDEDTAIILDAAIFDAGFNDPDGNTLQEIRIETFPNDGVLALSSVPVVAGQVISRADLLAGNLVYTGNQDFNGTDDFLWTGSDGIAFSNDPPVAATITVNPINDAPGLEAGADTTVGEGLTLNRQLTLTDPDVDNRSFTVDFGDGSAVQNFDSTSLMPNISHSYASEGMFTVTVTVDDNAGEANSIEVDTFEVAVVNSDPNASNDSATVSEDGPSVTGNVLTNDSDPGGDSLVVSEVNGEALDVGMPLTLASGALFTLNADGSFDYDPNDQFENLAAFQNGSDQVTYQVSDGEGGFDTATLFLTIDGQNDDPIAQDDAFNANDDSTISGNVLDDNGSGLDSDIDNLSTLTVTALNGQAGDVGSLTPINLPSGALLTLNSDGTFDYDPNGAFTGGGVDSFTYTLGDGQGASDTATVTITLNATNQPPVAEDDVLNANEDMPLAGNVLANNGNGADSDPDGDPLTVTQINGVVANVGSPVTLAGGGIVTLQSNGDFSFDPDGQYETLGVGQTAIETFTYTIEDGQGGSDTATSTITIDGVNDDPAALTDNNSTDEDNTVSGNVLTNDGDIDIGDVLSVSEVGGSSLAVGVPTLTSSGGSITLNSDGSYIYDPGSAFNFLAQGAAATDSIQYTVEDGQGGSDVATLFINVDGVNDGPTAQDDDVAASEDSILNGDLTDDNGNGPDSDPDQGDIPFISAVNNVGSNVGSQITLGSGALLVVNGSGTFTYDPNGQFETLNSGEMATETFTYTLEDSQGATDTATVTVTINGNADDPVAVDDDLSTDEDTPISDSVLTNDSDADGDTLAVSAVNGQAGDVGNQISLVSGALLTLNTDGTFDYDPNGQLENLAVSETDIDSFTYTVSDGNGGSDTATVTITINGVNDAPTAQPDTFSTDEETALVGLDLFADNGGGADSDPDASDMLTVTQVNGSAGNVGPQIMLPSGALLTVLADGSASYDPNSAFNSLSAGVIDTDSFTYLVDDGNGGSDAATVTVTITGLNDDPNAVDDALNVAVDAGLSGNVLLDNGNGADNDPDADDALSVTELNGSSAALGVATALSSGALVTLNADGTFDYDQNGAFSGLGSGSTATDSFMYTISDGNGGTDTAEVTITIGGSNLPPIAVDDAFLTDEDTAFTTGNVLFNDTDANNDTLMVSGFGTTGTIGNVINNGDGTFDYDPNGQFESLAVGETDIDSFTYTVNDGNGGSDTATVDVTITGVNDGPTAVGDVFVISEDETTPVPLDLVGDDTDPDTSDMLSVAAIDTTLTMGDVVLSGGTVTYSPNAQFENLNDGDSALDTFTYTVTDLEGATDTATVTITVTGVNDAPVAQNDAFSTDEDSQTSGNVFGDNGNGADIDVDDALMVSAVNGNPGNVGGAVTLGSGASLTLNADGTFDYDPNGAFESLNTTDTATDTFTYTISDPAGATDTATVTVTVTGVNDAPVAQDDAFSTDEDTSTNGNVFDDNGNGADADVDDSLMVSAVNGNPGDVGGAVNLGSGASLTLNADGTFDYDPNGAFESLNIGETDTDTFTYTLSDPAGATDTATVTITVTGVNDAPVAQDDVFSTDEDTSTNGNVFDDNANGADADVDDALMVSAVNGNPGDVGGAVNLGSGASLILNADGTFDYDPNGAFESLNTGETETDTFSYTITDSQGETDTATVTITIDGVTDVATNNPPTAQDDAFSTNEDTALTSGDLFADNGNGIDDDPDGDTINVSQVNGSGASVGNQIALASGALLTVDADGTFDYDPNGQFEDLQFGATAVDSFEYTINDGQGGNASATATITVSGVNDAPIAVDDAVTTDEDNATSGNVFADNDNGVDFDVDNGFVVSAVNGFPGDVGAAATLGSGASLTLNADGTFDYDPNGAFESLNMGETATDSFTYTITDDQGATDTATVTVTIDGVDDVPTNNPPIAMDDEINTDEDNATNGNVFDDNGNGIDDDPDGDTLQVTRVNGQASNVGSQITLVSGALLTLDVNGNYAYDPSGAFESLNVGETATDSFTYTIADGNGGSDTATVNVTIDGVDDNAPPIAQDDIVSTDEDSAITNGDVTADNGNGVDEDPNGDPITVTEVNGNAADVGLQITLGSGALLTLNADGTFDYDPNGQFESLNTGDTAFDSFDYTIDDGNGGADTATVSIEITGINERVGDAPVRLSRANRDGWEDAWTNPSIDSIMHTEDYDNGAPFLNVRFTSSFSNDIRGGDIANGDLGVSGQSIASSVVRQEIDGSEALRFTLVDEAMELTFGVSNFFSDDDSTGFNEAGRVLLLDDQDNVVGEQTFFADNADGTQEVNVSSQQGFTQAVFTAGAYDTNMEFVFGGYAASNGDFGGNPFTDAAGTHASEYLLDYFEFEFSNTNPLQAPLGVSNDPGDVT